MIIISKFQDYYDNALMYGHDDSIRYIRKTEEIKHENEREWFSSYPELRNTNYRVMPFYLGFCGKFFAGLRVRWGFSDGFDQTFYDAESFVKYIYNIRDKSLRKEEVAYFERTWYNWFVGKRMSGLEQANDFFGPIPDNNDKFFELGCPIFMTTRKRIITNPQLSEFGFYRVFQAPQAFQEIDMYLSGVLGSAHPPMVEISDESMRDKKGFDEWSFKTRPTKRS